MTDHDPALPRENVLDMPKSWQRHLHPRRGGAPGPKIKRATVGEEELRAPYADVIEKVLAHRRTDPALAAAAREHLAGTVSPLGAAAVAAVPESEFHSGEMTARFVDAWVTTHGLRFAVHAFLERCDIEVGGYGAAKSGLVLRDGAGLDSRSPDAAKRLRLLLAAAADTEYGDVVDLLAGLRTTPVRQALSAYLVPTEHAWVDECCAAPEHSMPRELLLRALGLPAHLDMLGSAAHISVSDCYDIGNLVTLADGVGPAIAPYLAEAFGEHHDEPRRRKALLEVLGRLPGDEAFRLMLDRAGNAHMRTALRETMRRFPVRAVRLLAPATAGGDATAQELLTDHLRAHAELLPRMLPELPDDTRATVEKLSAADGRLPESSADALPRLLVDPPWARTAPKARPVVLKGLYAPEERTMAWAPGERETWRRTELANPGRNSVTLEPAPPPGRPDEVWEKRMANIRDGVAVEPVQAELYWQAGMFAKGPEELVRPVLREWAPDWRKQRGFGNRGPWSPDGWLRTLIARFELDALPVTLDYARSRPAYGPELLLPFRSGEVAQAMAHWLLNTEAAREAAVAWFARHGRAALPHLVPVALGKAGRARTAAEYALHFLAGQEGRDAVLDAAREHGERPAELVEALLAGDPEELRPPRKIPTDLGVDAEVLPQVLLRGRERALPVPAVRHLLTLLAITAPADLDAGQGRIPDPDPDLASVLDACDGQSLAEFGWALFRHWQEHGAKPMHAWQFTALGRLGDDRTVRRLVPLIRAWPAEDGHHHAVRGLDVLVLIGSESALSTLRGLAQSVKFKGLKKHAQEKAEQLATARAAQTGAAP
ncbi:hypothetical protein DVA86_19580 [Streptomyces armeniacus]|uniref:HEAT repeat domain-containing protein n=1 Tax=Streptomyces armeniacus TaxID=83291 RepID=A0A345XSA4_9ACTN|nr:hypothetical protein [Streptomyces armeniacus]AXK34520.1 hypothetical protein DVA86_19580 [Streptomyces armeniacus]